MYADVLNLIGVQFDNNQAELHGGCLFALNNNRLILQNGTTFDSCDAGEWGGGAYVSTNGSVVIDRVRIEQRKHALCSTMKLLVTWGAY